MDLSADTMAELSRRHKSAATAVLGLVVAIVLLCVIAYFGKAYFPQRQDPVLEMAALISMVVLGLGLIVWRRTKFSAMRLQDIGALQGAQGLLNTLQRTTKQLAIGAATIALVGFLTTIRTGDDFYTYRAAALGAAFLFIYCYPTKSSWIGTLRRFGEKPATSPTNSSETDS